MVIGHNDTCVLSVVTSWLRLSLGLLWLSNMTFGDASPPRVGVGVVERGGLVRLETGDVAREAILDPGTEAEKNFFEDPNTGLKDLEILSAPHWEPPLGIGDTRLLLNSSFLFLFDLLSNCLKDSIEENLARCGRDLASNFSSLSILSIIPWFMLALLLTEELVDVSVSIAFLNLLKQLSQTRYGLFGFGAIEALSDFLLLHEWQNTRPQL